MKTAAVLTSLALASVALMTAAPAQAAAPLMHERVTFPDESVECGYDVVQTFSISNLLLDSNPSSDEQFFRFSYTWQSTGVCTNPLTGEQAFISGHGVYKEIQPVSLEDGLFTYVEDQVGTFVLSDSAGDVLLREAGRFTLLWLFDSLSDSLPGGSQISATLLSVAGPHASSCGDLDYCAVLDSAIGWFTGIA